MQIEYFDHAPSSMLPPTKKKKLNPMLMKVIIISALVHVVAAFVAGVVTIATHVMQEDAQFDEPPAVQEEEPPKEVKVEIKPQRPKQAMPMSNLRMRPVANIAVADVDVDLPSLGDSFTVSAGLGGVGGGNLLSGARGNIGMGMSDVSVFGLKTRAERVLFVIDGSRRMVLDEKGGLNSYRVIKDEIADMIGNLSAGTLFNVMLYDYGNVQLFKPQLVPAGAEVTAELLQWFAPVNSNLNNIGLPKGQRALVETKLDKYPEYYEGLRMDATEQAVVQKALEMKVDAIFQIAGRHRGFTGIRLKNTPQEIAAAKATRDKWFANPINAELMKAHEAEKVEMRKRVAEAHKKDTEKRAKKGLPPKVLENHLDNNMKYFGLKWKNPNPVPPPPHPEHNWQDEKSIRRYYHELMQQLYHKQDRTPPSVNVILFLAGDEKFSQEKEAQVKRFTDYFKGKYRILRGQNEIGMAASAKETKN
jgi:hypothetical protein